MTGKLYTGSDSEQNALSQFCRDFLKNSFWPFEEFQLSLKIPQTFLLYRENPSGEWQGFALGRVMGFTAELFFIYTRSEARGQGLARALLGEFEEHALKKYLADSYMLEVRVSNTAAIGLYQTTGYLKVGERKRYYQDGEDALVYSKQARSIG